MCRVSNGEVQTARQQGQKTQLDLSRLQRQRPSIVGRRYAGRPNAQATAYAKQATRSRGFWMQSLSRCVAPEVHAVMHESLMAPRTVAATYSSCALSRADVSLSEANQATPRLSKHISRGACCSRSLQRLKPFRIFDYFPASFPTTSDAWRSAASDSEAQVPRS